MNKSFNNAINKVGKINLNSLQASYHDAQLSEMLRSLGNKNYKETIRIGRLLKKQNPDSQKVAYVLAAGYAAAGNISEAIDVYEEIINNSHNEYTAHSNLGALLFQRGEFAKAEHHLELAISLNEKNLNAYMILGTNLHLLKRDVDACRVYENAIKNCTETAGLYNSYAISLRGLKDFHEAEKILERALSLDPSLVKAHYNLANIYLDQEKLEDAVLAFNEALKLDPDHFNANFYLAEVYQRLGKLEKAKIHLEKLIQSPHCNAEVYMQLGAACKDMRDLAEAYKWYKKALSIAPSNAKAQVQLSMINLKKKKFELGFRQYEARWLTSELREKNIRSEQPLWNGQKNKTIHVWSEQGIGDFIMYASVLTDLLKISSQVIVSCDKRLIPLFSNSFPKNIVFTDKDTFNQNTWQYDYHVPIGSLPKFFRKVEEDYRESSGAFIKLNQNRINIIRQNLTTGKNVNLIGISWQGGSPGKRFRRKNRMELASFVELLNHPRNIFVNLQYGEVSEEIAGLKNYLSKDIKIVEGIDLFNDLSGLASIMSACDRIVTVDNLNTHLAGALGIRTHVFLPYSSDWRWGEDDISSYWHDSLTLHRQDNPFNWNGTFDLLKKNAFNLNL